jgi:hypothetical protein
MGACCLFTVVPVVKTKFSALLSYIPRPSPSPIPLLLKEREGRMTVGQRGGAKRLPLSFKHSPFHNMYVA